MNKYWIIIDLICINIVFAGLLRTEWCHLCMTLDIDTSISDEHRMSVGQLSTVDGCNDCFKIKRLHETFFADTYCSYLLLTCDDEHPLHVIQFDNGRKYVTHRDIYLSCDYDLAWKLKHSLTWRPVIAFYCLNNRLFAICSL
jgi:hypothetical protein